MLRRRASFVVNCAATDSVVPWGTPCSVRVPSRFRTGGARGGGGWNGCATTVVRDALLLAVVGAPGVVVGGAVAMRVPRVWTGVVVVTVATRMPPRTSR